MPGVFRTRSLACKNRKHTSKSPQVRRTFRHSLRDGFTAYSALSLVNRAFLPPSPAQRASVVAALTSASRRQDHTTSPSASSAFVLRTQGVHRIPHPTFGDDRETPLFPGTGRAKKCF